MSDVNEACAVAWPSRPWYRHDRFPLLPEWDYRGEDRFNSSDWWFKWGPLTVWTMMSPELGLGIEVNDQDLELRIRVPYLIIRFHLPIFPRWLYQKTWRTGRNR